jgi:hypothetical protein
MDIRLSGSFNIDLDIETAFPLFSPLGEKAWIAHWDPTLVYPPGVEWAEGQIFRAAGTVTEGVWAVARLDREAHRATYYRVEGHELAARIDVACDEVDASTRITVTYTFIGLSPKGDEAIAGMSQEAYEGKMKQWKEWIEKM